MTNVYIKTIAGGETTTPTTSHYLELDDGTNSTYISITNLLKIINSLTADGSPDTAADYVVTYDASAGTVKKVLLSNVTSRAALGLATSDTPQFTGIEVGNAADTTLSRSAAGVLQVEGVVIPTISSTNTLTNKRVTLRTDSTTSSATPTINTDNVDMYHLTAQAVDITSFTTNLTGTPTNWQPLYISVTGTAARAITWGASFEAGPAALPTTTTTTQRLDVAFRWNSVTSKWRCMASGSA